MKKMKTACAYIRVSTHGKQEELSPDAQKRLILEYCRKNKILLSEEDIFMDLGQSGTESQHRLNFNRMIATCKSKEHPYDLILVWKFSRFARNQEESIVFKRMLKKNNVEVISISEPIPEGMMGELIERILEWMDEYYSINLSQEVFRGMTEKALRGGYLGSQPYGYSLASKEIDHIPKPIPEEADVIKYIYDRYVNGNVGFQIIARELNNKGLRTRNNNNWNSDTLEYMVMNPFYIGKTRWNYAKHDSARTINPKDEWIIADAQHEPLVSEQIWNKAQEKLERSRKPTQKRGRLAKKHWLSGILVCDACGGSINYHSAYAKRNQSAFFQCRKNYNYGCNVSQYTIVSKMENDFFEGLKQCVKNNSYSFAGSEENDKVELNTNDYLQKQLDDLDSKLKKLNMAYLSDIYTKEEFLEIKAGIVSEIEYTKLLMTNNKSEDEPEIIDMPKRINDVISILKSNNFTIEQKNESLKQIVQKVVFSKEKQTMDFYFWE